MRSAFIASLLCAAVMPFMTAWADSANSALFWPALVLSFPGYLVWRAVFSVSIGTNAWDLPLIALFNVMIFAFISACITWVARRRRPPPPGHCRKCRYDLTGNTSGVCPECGTAVE